MSSGPGVFVTASQSINVRTIGVSTISDDRHYSIFLIKLIILNQTSVGSATKVF